MFIIQARRGRSTGFTSLCRCCGSSHTLLNMYGLTQIHSCIGTHVCTHIYMHERTPLQNIKRHKLIITARPDSLAG